MNIKSILAAAAVAVSFTTVDAAQAATYGTISSADHNSALAPLGLTDPLGGWYGANLYLVGGPANIQATILGSEAGYKNSFTFGGTTYTTAGNTNAFSGPATTSSGYQQWTQNGVVSGLLAFIFGANSGASTVANGANTLPTVPGPNFFVSFLPDAAAGFGQSVLLFLDDGGAGSDDNHDDLVVRLDIVGGHIAPVPVPAAGILLAGALGGLATLRRRRGAKS